MVTKKAASKKAARADSLALIGKHLGVDIPPRRQGQEFIGQVLPGRRDPITQSEAMGSTGSIPGSIAHMSGDIKQLEDAIDGLVEQLAGVTILPEPDCSVEPQSRGGPESPIRAFTDELRGRIKLCVVRINNLYARLDL